MHRHSAQLPDVTDTGTTFDTGSDTTSIDAALACDTVRSEFAAYLAAHDSCTTSDECTNIGGTVTCECAPYLGEPSGNGIRKDAVVGATKYLKAFYGTCTEPKACNAAGGPVSCSMGHCRVSSASCTGGDAGPG